MDITRVIVKIEETNQVSKKLVVLKMPSEKNKIVQLQRSEIQSGILYCICSKVNNYIDEYAKNKYISTIHKT